MGLFQQLEPAPKHLGRARSWSGEENNTFSVMFVFLEKKLWNFVTLKILNFKKVKSVVYFVTFSLTFYKKMTTTLKLKKKYAPSFSPKITIGTFEQTVV